MAEAFRFERVGAADRAWADLARAADGSDRQSRLRAAIALPVGFLILGLVVVHASRGGAAALEPFLLGFAGGVFWGLLGMVVLPLSLAERFRRAAKRRERRYGREAVEISEAGVRLHDHAGVLDVAWPGVTDIRLVDLRRRRFALRRRPERALLLVLRFHEAVTIPASVLPEGLALEDLKQRFELWRDAGGWAMAAPGRPLSTVPVRQPLPARP